MRTYEQALEPKLLAAELIGEHHPHLEAARIAYLFTEEALTAGGRPVGAKAQLAGSLLAHLAAVDFVLLFATAEWAALSDTARRALVDEALCRCGARETAEGETVWEARAPDVQAFTAVVERYGPWRADVRRLVEAGRRWTQPDLPLGGADGDGGGDREEAGAAVTEE